MKQNVCAGLLLVFVLTVMYANGHIAFGEHRNLGDWSLCAAVETN